MSSKIQQNNLYRVSMVLIIRLSVVRTIMVNTSSKFEYKNLGPYGITGDTRTELVFSVQTCHDARVALLPNDPAINDVIMYEIVFGGSYNTKHTIRTRKNDNNYLVDSTRISGLLACNEFRDFWIAWDNFYIIAGTGHTVGYDQVVEYNDTGSEHYIVRYIGISTGWGTTGQWIFRNEIPTFTSVPPSIVYVTRGGTVILHCASVGIPLPVITWHREGANISHNQDNFNTSVYGYLTIVDFESTDSGIYRCIATNTIGENSHDIQVDCCDCCVWCETHTNVLHDEAIHVKLQNIKETLYVDRKETALSRRRRISADDPRPSSMIVGVTCGVSVLCTMVLLMTCTDIFCLLRYIVKLLSKKG